MSEPKAAFFLGSKSGRIFIICRNRKANISVGDVIKAGDDGSELEITTAFSEKTSNALFDIFPPEAWEGDPNGAGLRLVRAINLLVRELSDGFGKSVRGGVA
jgi:hypothetical protein